jgi:hypothetical protein
MTAPSILFGGMAVLALFAGQIWVLGPLLDRWSARANAGDAADPDMASLRAELLVRRLGQVMLRAIQAVAWLSGLLVLPWLFVIVQDGSWIMVPAVFAVTVVGGFLYGWTHRKLEALKGGLLSQFL